MITCVLHLVKICFTDVSVRLNGSEGNQGLLEMSIGGIWGTVCTDSFDDNDATVFCRMLGFKLVLLNLKTCLNHRD